MLTFYTRGFGEVGERLVNVTASDDGIATLLDQNVYGSGLGCLYTYAYTAPAAGELTLNFEAVNPADTWHHYAFSNELAAPVYLDPSPLPAAQISIYDQLSWTLNGSVESPVYHLKIATDPAMSNLVEEAGDLSDTSYDPVLMPQTNYYWQVGISDHGNVIYTSPVWSFETLPALPDAVKLLQWKFDETTGTIADQTGQAENADGILVGFNDPDSSWIPKGIAGGALNLNGMDEYVNVSSAYNVMPVGQGQSFSISGYIRTYGDYGPLFSMRNSSTETPIIDITLGADGIQEQPGKICLLVRDDAGSLSYVNSGLTVNDGQWHNVIVSRDVDDWTLSVDGVVCASMQDVAAGSLTLDWLAIGSSIEWISSDWSPSYTHYRYFKGSVEEFTVWHGTLQPPQVDQLISVLPMPADLNQDHKIDLQDFSELASEWNSDLFTPVQQTATLEDMETYAQGISAYWQSSSESGYGNSTLSLTSDTEGLYSQVLQWDYDLNENTSVKSVFQLNERRTDLSLYDRFEMRIKKLSGSVGDTLIADIYDGRDNLDPQTEGMHYKGRMRFDLSSMNENQWYLLQADIPNGFADGFPLTCRDLYEIQFFIEQTTQQGTGSILIDSIELIDFSQDCIPAVGYRMPDINADCSVDLMDFMTMLELWMVNEF